MGEFKGNLVALLGQWYRKMQGDFTSFQPHASLSPICSVGVASNYHQHETPEDAANCRSPGGFGGAFHRTNPLKLAGSAMIKQGKRSGK